MIAALSAILSGLKAIPSLISMIHSINTRIGQLEAAYKKAMDDEFYRETRELKFLLKEAKTAEEKHEAAKKAAELISRL